MESGNMVPFAVGARTGCVYFEPTQVYIAQGKPNKSQHNYLGKRLNKKSCQWVLVQRTMMRRKVPMYDIDVRGSHEQECGDDTCSWMAYERLMDDAQEKEKEKEKEKAHRQGEVSRTYSWPKKNRGLEAQREAVTHT
jgi:hypothetical protein